MTEDLRALLRADLGSERPPPLGDIVDAAIREGRRIRRTRRIRTFAASLFAVAAAVSAFVLVGDGGIAGRRSQPVEAAGPASPQSVPPVPPAPTPTAEARTLTIRSGTDGAGGSREKATPAAMLQLLTQVLPPGRTGDFAVAPEDDLQVQLTLDDGDGPSLVRVEVDKRPAADPPSEAADPRAEAIERQAATEPAAVEQAGEPAAGQQAAGNQAAGNQAAGNQAAGEQAAGNQAAGEQATAAQAIGDEAPKAEKMAPNATEPPRGRTVSVTITHMPDDCLRSMVVDAAWPDGTLVQVEVPTCLDGPQRPHTTPALTVDEAVRVAADPRWGVTMDAALVSVGAREFPDPPVSG